MGNLSLKVWQTIWVRVYTPKQIVYKTKVKSIGAKYFIAEETEDRIETVFQLNGEHFTKGKSALRAFTTRNLAYNNIKTEKI